MIGFLVFGTSVHNTLPGRRLRLALHPALWLPGARFLRWRRFERSYREHLAARRSRPSSDPRRSGG